MEILNASNYAVDLTNYFFWSGLFMSLTSLIPGLIIFLRDPGGIKNRRFFIFSLSVFFWAGPYTVWQTATNAETALFWSRVLMVGAIYIAVSFFHFTVRLLELREQKYSYLIKAGWVYFSLFQILNFTPYFYSHVEPVAGIPFWPMPGPLFHPFAAAWALLLLYGTWLIYNSYRHSQGALKKQLRLILVGFAIGIVAGTFNFLPTYRIDLAPWATPLASIYVIMTAYAMVKYQLFRITPKTAAKDIIATIEGSLFVIDREGIIRITNPKATEMLGMKTGLIIGKKISEVLRDPPEYIQEGSKPAETVLISKAGPVPVLLSSGRLSDGSGGIVILCHDISDYNKRVGTIREQNVKLDTMRQELEKANVELRSHNREIREINETMVGREMRLIEQKEEIARLKEILEKHKLSYD